MAAVAQKEEPQERLLGKPLRIPLHKIIRFKGQPRLYFNQLSLERLADSLMGGPHGEITQEQPIKVCKDPLVEGGYILIDGERRWRAFHIVEKVKGFEPNLLSFVEEIKNIEDHFRKSMISNLHREDLSDLDEAASLYRMHESGTPKAELAKIIGKTYSYVDNYCKLHTLPEEVKVLMDPDRPRNTRLNTSSAIDIARSTKDDALRIQIAEEIVHRNLSISEARYTIQVKTGRVPESEDGTVRKAIGFSKAPVETYKTYKLRLGKAKLILEDLQSLDLDLIYAYRKDEWTDREFDANVLQEINQLVTKLHEKVKEK